MGGNLSPKRRGFHPWIRLQELPLELTIYLLACFITPVSLTYGHHSVTEVIVTCAFGLGGLFASIGRLWDEPDAESAGLAFLLAGITFLFLRQLEPDWKLGAQAVIGLLFNLAALDVGFGIRLWVVRKAARARRLAADILAGEGNKHGAA